MLRDKGVAARGEAEAAAGSGCLTEAFLWWSVLFPSGFITVLSLARKDEPERHCEAADPAHLSPQIK